MTITDCEHLDNGGWDITAFERVLLIARTQLLQLQYFEQNKLPPTEQAILEEIDRSLAKVSIAKNRNMNTVFIIAE